MRIWEVLIKDKGEYGELCCTKCYRYAYKCYKKCDIEPKFLVYTDVDDKTNLDEFQNRGKIDSQTIIFKEINDD